jgi:HK97 gp10 family phage protein
MPVIPEMRFRVTDDPFARMKSLKDGVKNRILRKAMRAAASPILIDSRANAPRQHGTLEKSLALKIATNKKTGAIYAVIGPKRRFKVAVADGVTRSHIAIPTQYTHLVILGVRPHSTRKGDTLGRTRISKKGKASITPHKQTQSLHPGAAAQPFLQKVMRSNAQAALVEMRRVIGEEIRKLLSKSATKARSLSRAVDS